MQKTLAILKLGLAALLMVYLNVGPAWAQLSDITKSGSITANGGTVETLLNARAGAAFVLTGTWAATIVADVTADGGTTWENVDLYDLSARGRVASTTSNGTYVVVGLSGMNSVRVRASAYTSGTVTVFIRAGGADLALPADVLNAAPAASAFGTVVRTLPGTGASATEVQGTAADGAAAVGNPVQTGGKDAAGNIQAILTDTGGAVQVDVESGTLTANQGTAAVVGNSWRARLADGTNDAAALQDLDSGAGTDYRLGVNLRKIASGGSVEAGTSADPLRTDPTGTTTQPVSDAAGSLTVDSPQLPAALSGSGNLKTAVTEALPAGTNAIGKLAANSGVDIGDVDILSIAAGDTNIGNVDLASAIPAGTNYIGKVRKTDGINDVGVFVDADTGAGTEYREGVVLRKMASGGSVEAGTSADPLRVDVTGTTTQPVSGTITANQGTAAAAANSWRTRLSDGTNDASSLFDADSGAGTQYLQGVALRKTASGGSVEAGTSTDPLRMDPTGTTAQPVTDNAGSLTVDSAQLPAALSGSGNLKAAVVEALPAGTNAIGKLAANSGVDIGDVDVTSHPAGSIAGTTAKTADLDTGAGADTVMLTGVAVGAAGGAVAITGDAANGLDVDVTRLPALVAGSANIGDVDIASIAAGDTNIGNVDIVTGPTGLNAFEIQGTVADGGADAQKPVAVAGKDGSGNRQTLLTDTSGAGVSAGLQGAIPTGLTRLALTNGVATQGPNIACKRCTATSDDGGATNGNTAVVWAAGSDVAANVGTPLRPGASLTGEVTNCNKFYFFVGAASHFVTFFVEQ